MPEDPLEIRTECYSGWRGEETPRRFYIKARKIEIVRIIDRWVGPDHRYFKVLGDDDGVYIIRHDADAWKWELTFYKQADFSP